jgi:hypothetical protein
MKLFGRKSAGRALARPALARGFSWGWARAEAPATYEAQVRAAYAPLSTLLSPASSGARDYLKAVARALVQIAVERGARSAFTMMRRKRRWGADTVPSGYRLRRAVPDGIVEGLEAAGLVRVEGGARAGDVLLIAAGPTQFHLGVKTEAGFVHACALLKRVVETPGIPENLVGVWRRGHP